MKYTYKDFGTGKLRFTRSTFSGWTNPGGLLNVRYAIFSRRSDDLLIPEYLLTSKTREAITELES